MRAGVIQMVSKASVKENLFQVEEWLKVAALQELQLVVLPENFAFMGKNDKDKYHIAETAGEGDIQRSLSLFAKKYRLWIIAGTMPIKGSGHRVRAANLVFDCQGQCVARYDKIHLFDVAVSSTEQHRESSTIEPGTKPVVVDTPIGRVGLTVCYDLRFPELYQQLLSEGAEIFSVPSAFTAITGALHWQVLLRARAIENMCYVLAANQGGIHENGRETYGYSMIIEPWGKIMACHEKGEGIITETIDLSHLHDLRQQFPCNEHHVLVSHQQMKNR